MNGETPEYTFKEVEEIGGKIKLLLYAGTPIKSEADIIAYHDINLEYWKMSKLKTRTWEVGAKVKFPSGYDTGGKIVYTTRVLEYPLHYIAAEFSIRHGDKHQGFVELTTAIQTFHNKLIKDLTIISPYVPSQDFGSNAKGWLEMMICDLHYGKIAYDAKKGMYTWDNDEIDKHVDGAVEYFLGKKNLSLIKGVIFPVGNDVIHIDNLKNTTTSGNHTMDVKQLWWHLVLAAKNMYIRTIEKLSQTVENVIVPVIPGNHDYQTCFAIGEILSAHFKNHANVTIINDVGTYPAVEFGKCLIGYLHGNELTPLRAHTMLSIEHSEAFGRTLHRAVHAGHLHINIVKEVFTKFIKHEEGTVEVEFCPSICPADRWHGEKLFKGVRRVKAFLWHENLGKLEEYYYNIKL